MNGTEAAVSALGAAATAGEVWTKIEQCPLSHCLWVCTCWTRTMDEVIDVGIATCRSHGAGKGDEDQGSWRDSEAVTSAASQLPSRPIRPQPGEIANDKRFEGCKWGFSQGENCRQYRHCNSTCVMIQSCAVAAKGGSCSEPKRLAGRAQVH